jgi:hypothetical protein
MRSPAILPGQIDGREVPGSAQEATVTDVEGLSGQPRQRSGRPGLLCGADGLLQSALRARDPRPRTTTDCAR